MSRTYSPFVKDDKDAQALLDVLVSKSADVAQYRDAMRSLGTHLAQGLKPKLGTPDDHDICVVCTVEDADFLARGVLEGLAEQGLSQKTRMLCLWNGKVRESGVSISPVLRQYKEAFDPEGTVFIIVKSIISGACVVKTNLTRAISKAEPSRIFVVAPVMLEGAEKRLEDEFPSGISDKFEYVWFATDTDKDGENVVPGIGGSVYDRLGLGNEDQKNRYMPEIVKERRSHYAAATALA